MDKARQILSVHGGGLEWLKAYYDRPFKKQGKGYRSKDGKVSIVPGSAFDAFAWIGKDFTSHYRSGNLFSIYAAENFCSVGEAIKRLTDELNLIGETPPPPKVKPTAPAKPAYPWEPNRDRNEAPSTSYRYEVDPRPVEAYPKPIRPETLARYGVKRLNWIQYAKGNSTPTRTNSTDTDPLFLFTAGANTKIYRPFGFNGPKDKQRPAHYVGNYVFGYDQLPERCRYILIAAGQNDTLALNDCLNDAGIYAVCLWSEGGESYLTTELLNDLSVRCEAVFVAYDDDATGNRTSKAMSREHGTPRLTIPHSFFVNDVCDVLADGISRPELAAEVERQISLHQRRAYQQQATGPDPFAWPIQYAAQLPLKGKISENARARQALQKFLMETPRAYLVANTGAGKTYFLLKHFAKETATGQQPLIIAVPTQSLADQIGREYAAPVIRDKATDRNFAAIRKGEATVIVSTYDSLWRVKNILTHDGRWQDTTVIFDEAHHLVLDTAKGYKFDEFNKAFDLVQNAARVVQVSGTPIPYFDRLGFKYFGFDQQDTAPLDLYPVTCDQAPERVLLAHLQQRRKLPGIEIVYLDNKKTCAAMARQVVAAGLASSDQVAVLNSDTKEANPAYGSIINSSSIPQGIKYLFTTRLIADGVNLYNHDIAGFHMVALKSPFNEEIFVQLPARARKLKRRSVYVYNKEPQQDLDQPRPRPSAEILSLGYGAAYMSLRHIQACEPDAAPVSAIADHYRTDAGHLAVYRAADGQHKVSDLYVFHQELNRRDRNTSTEEFYQRLAAKYPYICLQSPLSVQVGKDTEKALKADQRAEKQAKAQVYRKLEHQPEALLRAAYDSSTSTQQRRTIEPLLPADKQPDPAADELRESCPEIFDLEAHTEPVKQVVKLAEIGYTVEASGKVLAKSENRTRKGLSTFLSRTWLQLALHLDQDQHPRLNAIDLNRARTARKLRDELTPYVVEAPGREIPQHQRLTGRKLAILYQSLTGQNVTPHKAVQFTRELYQVEEGRCKDKRRFYWLRAPLTLADVAEPYGMTAPELLCRARGDGHHVSDSTGPDGHCTNVQQSPPISRENEPKPPGQNSQLPENQEGVTFKHIEIRIPESDTSATAPPPDEIAPF